MRFYALLIVAVSCPAVLTALDLRKAIIVLPASAPSAERKAAQMLTEEIAKRTQISIRVSALPESSHPAIYLGTSAELAALTGKLPSLSPGKDGFRIGRNKESLIIAGNDPRGVLFGAGYLLRHLHMERQIVEAPDDFTVSSAPRYPLRGHQLGYRPKVNTYDGWTVAQFEQYIRDLAIFGTNAIELIPPRSDDDDESPHFLLSKIDMMEQVSRICDQYGMDVWVWFPAMDQDYSNPGTVAFALKEWDEVFRRLPRIDAVFVPGGDPGHTRPKQLMDLLEQQTNSLHQRHPGARMWMSPQSFSTQWMEEWLQLLSRNPAWLTGVVYGPQVRLSLPELRAKVPAQYPIRHYPDITHSRHCQYPVPDWDLAFASTEGRETINPRPLQQGQIFHLYEHLTAGFLTYSEGVNDDLNKFIWSGLGWNPDTPVLEILHQYSRYFIDWRFTGMFSEGLLALERNWQGALATNTRVNETLGLFQKMERTASPAVLGNWRFQTALYRAYYDGYTQARLIAETEQETLAMNQLRLSSALGSKQAMEQAGIILDRATAHPSAPAARARIFELAEALFQSIRMQLSVGRYRAEATERGANLDTLDIPLNNRGWLQQRFIVIRKMASESERLQALNNIVNWADPGPGGFYDDLGNPARQPHLLQGPGFERDPAYFRSALTGFAIRGLGGAMLQMPRSWWSHAETLYDTPLQMQYRNLDKTARYTLRVVYAGDSTRPKIRLTCGNRLEVHPLMDRPVPVRPLEFDLPQEATASGTLALQWNREPGLGDAGRGLQVAEVWLLKR